MTRDALPNNLTFRSRRYTLGLSGGADSTYLALVAASSTQIDSLVFVHLNHELRDEESDADEVFCRALATKLNRPIVVASRTQLEQSLTDLPTNPSARYRAMRLHLFREVMHSNNLDTVLLAHHADDQAETVLLRLSRGGGLHSLGGIKTIARVNGIQIERPMLHLRSSDIRRRLETLGQAWREDSSNQSSRYRRNIARTILRNNPLLHETLCELAINAQATIMAMDEAAPALDERMACDTLKQLPPLLAEHAARRWLIARGAPADDVSPAVCQRLIEQASDPVAPLRIHYPGKLLVRRKKKHLELLR